MTLTTEEIKKDAEWLVAPANLANSKYSERARNVARAYLALPPVAPVLTEDERALRQLCHEVLTCSGFLDETVWKRDAKTCVRAFLDRLTSASVGASQSGMCLRNMLISPSRCAMTSALRIIENDLVPRMSHVGDEIKPLWPHPLAALFEYLFTGRVTPVMYVRGKKIEEPCAWMIGGNLFIHTEWARHLQFKDPRSVVDFSNVS